MIPRSERVGEDNSDEDVTYWLSRPLVT